MDKQFEFYGFISYSTADEKWAKWLHPRLEGYSIPMALRKTNIMLPRNPRPIFWYKTDLSGTSLHRCLQRELEASRYLILIASPSSARSEWVNDEVSEFVHSNRTDHIIPLIVDGQCEDPSQPDYCLPDVLSHLPREEQLRGIDVRKVGREHALVDIVATMFGLQFDSLWQRFERRKRLRRNIIRASLLVLSILGLLVWDFCRTKYEYYADYVIREGVPEGILPISRSDLKHRMFYYRFEYSRLRLRQVTHCDWYGNPHIISNTELADRFPIQRLLYQGSSVSAIEWQDVNGHTLAKGVFSSDMTRCDIANPQTGDAMQSGGSTTTLNFDQNALDINLRDFWPLPKSCIGRYVYKYDRDGYLVQKLYRRDNRNTPIADADGISGFDYTLDSLHRVTSIQYLDTQGARTSNKAGVSRRDYSYSKEGVINKVTYHDINGQLTMCELGCAVLTSSQDQYGNPKEERNFDDKGKPCINSFGFHRMVFEFAKGRESQSCYDTAGKPTLTANPVSGGYHRLEVLYDKEGNAVEVRNYDTRGKLCSDAAGVSIYRYKYDGKHRVTSATNYDPNGYHTVNAQGIYCSHITYDGDGRCTGFNYTDSTGAPYNSIQGIAQINFHHKEGKVTRIETRNSAGFPVCTQMLAMAAAIDLVWDVQNSHVEQVRLYGYDGRLLQNGIAIVQYEYDSYDNCTRMAFKDASGAPAYHYAQQYASAERAYDKGGHILCERHLMADGTVKDGMYTTYKYLPNGYLYRTELRDTTGRLCNNIQGWSVQVRKFHHSVFVSDTFLDKDEKPVIALNQGACTIRYESTPSRQVSRRSFFAPDGHKMLNTLYHVHEIRYEYDAAGNCTRERNFDVNGNPTECASGYHMRENTYDGHRYLVRQRFTDRHGHLAICKDKGIGYAYAENKVDGFGNICSIKCYDERMKPSNNDMGIHQIRRKFRSKSKIEFEAYYDKDGHLVVPTGLPQARPFAMQKFIFNDQGNTEYNAMFDEKRKAVRQVYAIFAPNGAITSVITKDAVLEHPIEMFSDGRQEEWATSNARRDSIGHILDSLCNVCQHLYE